EIPVESLTVITGVSGSGKSSLAFDTLYAEGQRRYVECLSSYARQFLDRMDRPKADLIEGILPTVALQQSKRLRAARSTVATLTETSEYLKVVFARAAVAHCPQEGHGLLSRASAPTLTETLCATLQDCKALLTFAVKPISTATAKLALDELQRLGFHRVWVDGAVEQLGPLQIGQSVDVIVDRLVIRSEQRDRLFEAIDAAMARGRATLWLPSKIELELPGLSERDNAGTFRGYDIHANLQCSQCDHQAEPPSPNVFSWNSPVGACETCNGFGRIMTLDEARCIPNTTLSLAEGAIKPWSTSRTEWERGQLFRFCEAADIDIHTPWRELSEWAQNWIMAGYSPEEDDIIEGAERYYGLRQWFTWLEGRTYRMHVRVLLSRYRRYVTCPTCKGSRLKPEALQWQLAGRDLWQWFKAPVSDLLTWIDEFEPDEATKRPMQELHRRIALLDELGLGYVSLNRPGRSLSGGELQRVQLVTALASGLSQVLYVLDEPSVGLHARDSERLLRVLDRLKQAGNTIVMVEHDPTFMLAADHLIDLGPQAGAAGGHLVYAGPPEQICDQPNSLTGDYLAGRKAVTELLMDSHESRSTEPKGIAKRARKLERARTKRSLERNWVLIHEPQARNLRGGVVRLRTARLNVICGVSGSGKSTLLEDVLYRGALRALGRSTEEPGAHLKIEGIESFDAVVLVEQAAVAGNSRANPATYLKLWDQLRKRLAKTPLAQERGLSPSTFSFNRPGGRCHVCEGTGSERVDMQFLSDVLITCEACNGSRFAPETLEVRLRGLNAADLLASTAQEIADSFADDPKVAQSAQALCDLGLGYLRLGQPLSTLSGGESQRLKVAWHLLCDKSKKTLFLLDEPTTGLHLDDVRVMLDNLRQLVDRGNTVVVIEHHLDVIIAADHVIELGPEGGPAGGQLLWQGPSLKLMELGTTPTGRWLRQHHRLPARADALPIATPPARLPAQIDPGFVAVRGARVHNLQDISVDLPRNQLTVITGLSGSGKSSLAFDVVFAEGQRRFLDCLSPYARQYLPPVSRPDVDSLHGLPPTVAISQRTTRGGYRSTVGTLTEIQSYLRLLFARCGRLPLDQSSAMRLQSPDEVGEALSQWPADEALFVMVRRVSGRKGFHRDVIDKIARSGATWLEVDGQLCPIDAVPPLRRYVTHDIDEVIELIEPNDAGQWNKNDLCRVIEMAMKAGDGSVRVRRASTAAHTFEVATEQQKNQGRPAGLDPMTFSFTSSRGWCPTCRGTGVIDGAEICSDEDQVLRAGDDTRERKQRSCSTCKGARLCEQALEVTLFGVNIGHVASLTPSELVEFFNDRRWSRRDAPIAEPIVREIVARAEFMLTVGLDYLQLNRPATSLSGGESQRIRLAAQLSSNLQGVLYVLDEPTIGLHPADNQRLLAAFDRLIDRGNGLVVVEHDEATIRRADFVIELGPGGGSEGGHVIHAGSVEEMLNKPDSPTGTALTKPVRGRSERRCDDVPPRYIELVGARRNNLNGVDARLMRGRLNGVSGVSGSGKSTLIRDLLVGHSEQVLNGLPSADVDELQAITGLQGVGRVVEVDQSPIGRTPRSCPATYLGVWSKIRKLFAALPEAKVLGLSASNFSFNVKGGRCDHCKGAGQRKIDMSFLPTVYVPCEQCDGSRYNEQTLRVSLRGATVADVLRMSMAEAAEHFANVRGIHTPLELATRVGLGYLTLGQGSNTVSGGEAQRIKIVAELSKRRRKETLFVLDEPSTGLHLVDQLKLMRVLHELVDRQDTVVLIEHNIDVLREVDWLVDLGPGGGTHGGNIMWQGAVDTLVKSDLQTPTAIALRASVDPKASST
ncbi:MAG TPA: excinuclease ABC subunit A, partial [Myxococcales bacterium]|nr:excinuclease ABC subunit A [Myxococcales bacterium]